MIMMMMNAVLTVKMNKMRGDDHRIHDDNNDDCCREKNQKQIG